MFRRLVYLSTSLSSSSRITQQITAKATFTSRTHTTNYSKNKPHLKDIHNKFQQNQASLQGYAQQITPKASFTSRTGTTNQSKSKIHFEETHNKSKQ